MGTYGYTGRHPNHITDRLMPGKRGRNYYYLLISGIKPIFLVLQGWLEATYKWESIPANSMEPLGLALSSS